MKRRDFLRGVGTVAVGLPLLESIGVGRLIAQEGTPIKRFVCFFTCNGANLDTFFPSTAYGALSEASFAGRAIEPLAPFASKLLVPRGIHMVPRGFGRDPSAGDDHMKGMGCKLTASALEGDDAYATSISVDQEMAASINPGGRQPLTLKVGPSGGGVFGSISYTGAGRPVVGENNPWDAFRSMMGLPTMPTDPEEPVDPVMQRLVNRRLSVLDLVRGDFESLQAMNMSRADRDKLDLHFTAIRDIENRLREAGMMVMPGVGCQPLTAARMAELEGLNPDTVDNDGEYRRVGQMQMDVLALALACDENRVATIQWGNGAGGPVFRWDGINHDYNHHKLSHGSTADGDGGSDVAGYEAMLTDIDHWYATQFAYLLERLDAYTDGERTVLDNSVVVWANELSDGKDHDYRDLPIIIAGSGGGYLRQGQYIKVTAQSDPRQDSDAPHNRLLTTFLNAVGATNDGEPYNDFGTFGEPGEIDSIKA
jgi:hypothetical protein